MSDRMSGFVLRSSMVRLGLRVWAYSDAEGRHPLIPACQCLRARAAAADNPLGRLVELVRAASLVFPSSPCCREAGEEVRLLLTCGGMKLGLPHLV